MSQSDSQRDMGTEDSNDPNNVQTQTQASSAKREKKAYGREVGSVGSFHQVHEWGRNEKS